ncbi:MAG: putative polyglutamine synthesis accessory protein [Gammaproteobacteria bacterium]|nr:putative polyglutamine synthesis accessory protein [Gammaproteobacteria bacterium]
MNAVTLFLCGDVMTGRGIDQILPHPGRPHLHESWVRSALRYVELAERANGPFARPADFAYIWGDALEEIARAQPSARVINLETAVTRSEEAWPGKGIHYRMHPANLPCLTAAHVDCCVLANNHVLDWGHAGLEETLSCLHAAGLRTAGAGQDAATAAAPAVIDLPTGNRLLVFAWGMDSAGVTSGWEARADRAGVNLLRDFSSSSLQAAAQQIAGYRCEDDITVASIHWGGNWGYAIDPGQQDFAHRLIDSAGVDIVHGHSSHHPMGVEVHHDKLVLYGCGDLINDYEGIGGYEEFNPDLALLYFPTLEVGTGRLRQLRMAAVRRRRFRLERADVRQARALAEMLTREGRRLRTGADRQPDGSVRLRWT